VETAVIRLEKGKSPVIDDITRYMVQSGGEKVTEDIHAICYQIMQEGREPDDWGKLKVKTEEN
jgi:hypothetical protein